MNMTLVESQVMQRPQRFESVEVVQEEEVD